ncbi:4Fe-4S ferredoxin-type, iron-sulphur binding domain protein [Acididesulfobacillus acetoxydans]|uniref:4Fe-4S ferredoxin-type, iron-sulphur binding domain protein n=1 Tax=Acididesulfobacillus acetoxydans TaxID=1561005 RepID=A0A8S0X1U4_9FIRM|nr:4Fe-4S dicluster domain-containing protein [Acididesulfobacillus acetoxydans]CAA7603301.1 4Fe-4S ferredoxin-type, iron-sulphur binding domain protein [Acididesulfobacillus acetoxydans]
MIYQIRKDDFLSWLKKQREGKKVLVPTRKEEGYLFLPWVGDELDLREYTNTLKPVKDVFFPQWETLIRYRVEKEKSGEIVEETSRTEPLILFGVRPCDAKSIKLLDNVFDGEKYKDPYYCQRRKNTLIISLGCRELGPTCFCQNIGINPLSSEGSDILLVEFEDRYLAQSGSDTGLEILEQAPFTPAESKEQKIFDELNGNPARLNEAEFRSLALNNMPDFNDSVWEKLYQKCLNCGICTYLCPTCHCFDISEMTLDSEGKRVRSWDSCMYSSFTLHGSGHNPRPTGKERIRQRIMHKFNYFPQNYGVIACVGCGRCVAECPVNFDVREALKLLGVWKDDLQL